MEKFSVADALRMLNDDELFSVDSHDDEIVDNDDENRVLFIEDEVDFNDNESGTLFMNNDSSCEKRTEALSSDESKSHIIDINSNVITYSEHRDNSTSQIPREAETSFCGNEEPSRGRKRTKNEERWKQTIRKRRRQSGLEYTSIKGKQMRSRELKTKKDCIGNCRFRCARVFSTTDRESIFKYFWSLNDSEKNVFYANTTDKDLKERVRTKNDQSRRKCSYRFYFRKGTERIRICKTFYLTTLDISQRRVQYFYEKSNQSSPLLDVRGKHSRSTVSSETYDLVKRHIESFPRVESHYCRASSSKEYLEKGLSLTKMYKMYVEWCGGIGNTPARKNTYRKVFTSEYNIGFFIPKKDKCDICAEFEMATKSRQEVPHILITKHDCHKDDRKFTKSERDSDRANEDKIVVCFDMQNVIMCPRSNVSNFFYKRKLNVYNLTAHCSKDKTCYNVVWNEAMFGRGSNEIASALTLVLERVVEKFPSAESLILWSDSCVPQNKNSIMCFALKKFLASHPNLKNIIQKFGTPGHSAIQEVDNIHSHIEKRLKVSDLYSPLSFVRVLKSVRPTYMEVIQMKQDNVFDFQSVSNTLQFKDVPFSKLKCLKISQNLPFHVNFLMSFDESCSFQDVSILRNTRSKNMERSLPSVTLLNKPVVLSADKLRDLESMLKFLPPDDVVFFENLCKIGRCRPADSM